MLWILHSPEDSSDRGGEEDTGVGDAGGEEEYWVPDEEEHRYNDNPGAQLTGNGRTIDEYGAI